MCLNVMNYEMINFIFMVTNICGYELCHHFAFLVARSSAVTSDKW